MKETFRLRVGDVEYAVPVECPHRKGWLSRGKVNLTRQGKCLLMCPLHYSTFEVDTGRQVSGPAAHDLAVARVDANGSNHPEMKVAGSAGATHAREVANHEKHSL